MKDIFKSYHKHKVFSHFSLLMLSCVLAISINMLFVSLPAGNFIKTNVLETQTSDVVEVDFFASVREKQVVFQTHSDIRDMKEFSFSLAYDPEVLSFGAYTSSLPPSNISELKNESGFVTYIISFETPLSLPKNSEILSLTYSKLQEKTAFINPVQVNFKDSSGESFLLSTQQLMY